MSKTLVMYVVSETTQNMTSGKFLFGAELLRRAGMDVLVFTWSEGAFKLAQAKQFFAATPQIRDVPMTSEKRVAASKAAWEVLGWPISEQREAPTWARLLALDDVIGAVQEWQIGNLDVLRPDVIVKANQGAESSTPEDEQMDLVIGRWAGVNQIPVVAIEVQRADDVLQLKWPVRVLLTRQELAAVPYAEEVWRLPPVQRHITAMSSDAYLEAHLERGAVLREQLQLGERRMIFVPYHLHYTQDCLVMLQELGQLLAGQGDEWRVVFGCGDAFRRSYRERDMIDRGMVQAWRALGDILIAEGVDVVEASLAADVVAMPYKSSVMQQFVQRWGLEVWEVGEEWSVIAARVRRQKGLVEAVRGVLPHE